MLFLNFLRENPVMAWFAFLAALLTFVPVASVLWRRMSGRDLLDKEIMPAKAAKPARFGNQTELIIVLAGLLILLAVAGWIRSTFFG
ncbi:MAG: hypothetical protein A2X80_02555 [Geobacteraceae bacterium GWB2_52_12]|nr:MAG: hypothetical protein A2X80_02555 [Geobacteraceae bacterium GWB2_52_12]